MYWCFGLPGAARLAVTPEADGFLVYVAEQRRRWVIPRVELLREWLDANQHDCAGLTPLQEEFRRALGRDPGSEQG